MIFVSIPNEYFLVSCLLEDFKLKIDGGEFTDSEIIVMLGENGMNEFNCFVFRGEGWVGKGTCIWELYPWFLYTVSGSHLLLLFVCLFAFFFSTFARQQLHGRRLVVYGCFGVM